MMTPNQRDVVRGVVGLLERVLDEIEVGEAALAKAQEDQPDVAYDLRDLLEQLRGLLPDGP